MIFEECPPTSTERSISDTVTAYACKRLGLSLVELRFFRESDGEPVNKGYLKNAPFDAENNICGFSSWLLLKDVHTVWIRSGMATKELVITIGHEIYHLSENRSITPTNESKAEAFGQQIWQEMTTPATYWATCLYNQ